MMTAMLRNTHGIHARTTAPVPYVAPDAPTALLLAPGKSHTLPGFHMRQNAASAKSEARPPTMSTSSGPTKLLQTNCTIANTPPQTSTAGHTPPQAAPPAHRHDEPRGDDERYERQLPAGHLADGHRGNARNGREGEDGCRDCAEGDGRGVGDERESGRVQRREAEAHQERGTDGNRCAEARCAFDEGAERERDEQRLNAPVGRETGDGRFDDLELTGDHRQVVKKNGVDDDPADGEKTVGRPVSRRGDCGGHGHAED